MTPSRCVPVQVRRQALGGGRRCTLKPGKPYGCSIQVAEHLDTITWSQYVASSDITVDASLQTWQSEFLDVGAMATLSIYLRQRGASQSKPVGEAHSSTKLEG